jgi:hypothetical protein
LTDGGLVEALRRVHKLAQRGKTLGLIVKHLLEVLLEDLAEIKADVENMRGLAMQLGRMCQQVLEG